MPTDRRFVHLFGGSRENSDLVGIAKNACKEGFAVLPVYPGEKRPMCTLTDRARNAADRLAANEARDLGKKRWEVAKHDCGRTHAITDPAEAERVFKRLVAKYPDLNIGLEVGASHLLSVDADTAEEVASFTAYWAQKEGAPELASAAPTVHSPGVLKDAETWIHKNGGHFHFLLPDDTVNFAQVAYATAMKIGAHETKATLMFHDQLVLVPPSVRPEGPYRMGSDVQIAPAWMIEELLAYIAGHARQAEEQRNRVRDGDDDIESHFAEVSWESVLLPYGWTTSGRIDSCGCEIWTRPGDWSSPKSATAHDFGCMRFEDNRSFLHLWTDNPPPELEGKRTFSKLQVIAAYEYNGEIGTALREIGITRTRSEPHVMTDADRFGQIMNEPDEDEDEDPAQDDLDPIDALIAELISAADLDQIPEPDPLVDGILDKNTFTRVVGKSGSGKSFVMVDLAAHIALGMDWNGRPCSKGTVVYMVAEGASGMRRRVRAWEAHHGARLGDSVQFLPRPVQVLQQVNWLVWVAAMVKVKPTLIVIDTQARVTAGANENGPEDMGLLVERCELLRAKTGACVVLVHHKGHSGDHGRGHSSVLAALDAEIEVSKEGNGRIAVLSTKQKDREDFEPIRLDLFPVRVGAGANDTSAVLVAHGEPASSSTPFVDKYTVDESSPAHERLAKWIFMGFQEGAGGTKGEIKSYVGERDRGRLGKAMGRSAFYEAWTALEKAEVLHDLGSRRFILIQREAVRLGLVG